MAKSKRSTKKILRNHIARTLVEVFNDFEQQLGKRKFRRNIKKASKALLTDLKPVSNKQRPSSKKENPTEESLAKIQVDSLADSNN